MVRPLSRNTYLLTLPFPGDWSLYLKVTNYESAFKCCVYLRRIKIHVNLTILDKHKLETISNENKV